MLELTSEQIADAEACGVSFPAATPDQVQRYAMQKKVFRIGGELVLSTRDGALFETAGTLERLIAEGERQRRDLAEREAVAPVPAVEAPAPPAPAHAAEPGPNGGAGSPSTGACAGRADRAPALPLRPEITRCPDL